MESKMESGLGVSCGSLCSGRASPSLATCMTSGAGPGSWQTPSVPDCGCAYVGATSPGGGASRGPLQGVAVVLSL